jgi:hypothetical protein
VGDATASCLSPEKYSKHEPLQTQVVAKLTQTTALASFTQKNTTQILAQYGDDNRLTVGLSRQKATNETALAYALWQHWDTILGSKLKLRLALRQLRTTVGILPWKSFTKQIRVF